MQKTNNKNLILDEINIRSKIFHPNIIRLFNYIKDKKNIYLILEFASKGTLFDYIHYKKGLDEPEAFYYFIHYISTIKFYIIKFFNLNRYNIQEKIKIEITYFYYLIILYKYFNYFI